MPISGFLQPTAECGPTFSIKNQVVNILGFAVHTVSLANTQLCNYSSKAAIDYMKKKMSVAVPNKNLCTKILSEA